MTATTFAGHFLGPDVHASRPSASGLPEGTMYVCITHSKIERVVSGSWVDYASLGSGMTIANDTIFDAKGDLVAASAADTAARLAVGSNNQVLTADSAQTLGIKWATPSVGSVAADTIWDTKGDLAVATGADTASKLVVGSNGQALLADSSQTTGLRWGAPFLLAINAQSASYTLVLTDAGQIVSISNASANTLTVPTNASVAFAVGTTILVRQAGAGQTSVAGAGGVTVNSRGAALKLAGQYAYATLIKVATDTWELSGDITT